MLFFCRWTRFICYEKMVSNLSFLHIIQRLCIRFVCLCNVEWKINLNLSKKTFSPKQWTQAKIFKEVAFSPAVVLVLPEQAWGGSGKIKVVELFRRATIEPSDCGLKLRNCCIKSEHSISATSKYILKKNWTNKGRRISKPFP